MSTQAAYISELEYTATKHIQTPVSYIGARKMIWPLASGSSGWRSALRHAGVAVLLFFFWVLVTTEFYLFVFGFFLLAVVWLIYTQARRHRIRDARAALATRDQHLGRGGIARGPQDPPGSEPT